MTCSRPATRGCLPTATDRSAAEPAAQLAEALEGYRAELADAARLVVGYSGGMDSTVLLHALSVRFPGRVAAWHAHHGLHADAADWQRHCERCCADWDIPLHTLELTVSVDGRGVEAAARDARYAWFARELRADDRLLLAHHQDDQAETLLLRLLRGSGMQGLAGMPASRSVGATRLLRPFLALPRATLRAYAEAQGLRWIDDPSNDDLSLDRNFLRRQILPQLEQRWPGYRRTFGRATRQVREALDRLPSAPLTTVYSVVGDPGFNATDLPDDPADAALALRGWLRAGGLPGPSAARTGEFLRQLREGAGATLPIGELCLERYRDQVFCRRALPSPPSELTLDAGGGRFEHPGLGVIEVDVPSTMRPEGTLALRCRRGGERILSPGGLHHSLRTCFQDLALPTWWRDRIPLLYAGDELLLLGPLRRAAHPLAQDVQLRWQPPLPEGFGEAPTG